MIPSGRATETTASIGGRPIEAVIFDMDGVLVDSEPLHHRALNEILCGEGCPALSAAEYRRYLGTTERDMWEDLIARRHLAGPFADYQSRFDAMVEDAYRTQASVLPGVVGLVVTLKAKGLKLAVASSSPIGWVRTCLDARDLSPFFDAVVGGDMVAEGKPDPAVFRLAASRLGVAPAACAVIEDSPHGITAGRAAGMVVVAVETAYTSREAIGHADLRIRSLDELVV